MEAIIGKLVAIAVGSFSAVAVFGTLIAVGFWAERSTRGKAPGSGDNDVTEEDCQKLCAQIRKRHSEQCLAESDDREKSRRWQQAAAASAIASVAASAAAAAASAATASILGLVVAPALWLIAFAAGAAATAAAGFCGVGLRGVAGGLHGSAQCP
jgi:hypothetical protein